MSIRAIINKWDTEVEKNRTRLEELHTKIHGIAKELLQSHSPSSPEFRKRLDEFSQEIKRATKEQKTTTKVYENMVIGICEKLRRVSPFLQQFSDEQLATAYAIIGFNTAVKKESIVSVADIFKFAEAIFRHSGSKTKENYLVAVAIAIKYLVDYHESRGLAIRLINTTLDKSWSPEREKNLELSILDAVHWNLYSIELEVFGK